MAETSSSSFLELLLEAVSDPTLLLLSGAGVVSCGLHAYQGAELAEWIDGVAILASVAICSAVTAVTNYNKEAKFRQLNALKDDVPVRGGIRLVGEGKA